MIRRKIAFLASAVTLGLGTAAAVTRNRRIPQNTPIPPCTQAEPANFHYNTFPAVCIPGGKDRPKNAQK